MTEHIQNKIQSFFQTYTHQTYKKGEMLIRSDDDPRGIFYLIGGTVKQYAISKKGEELIVNSFKPQSFFPMSWAINQTPNHYFFEAMTDVAVFRAPKDDVITFLQNNPDVLYDLLSRVYKGLDGILTRMTHLMSENAHTRLVSELIIYAKRFGESFENIQLSLSEKDLAAQTGLTRETVSREIKVLKDKNLLQMTGNKLTIVDARKLEHELFE